MNYARDEGGRNVLENRRNGKAGKKNANGTLEVGNIKKLKGYIMEMGIRRIRKPCVAERKRSPSAMNLPTNALWRRERRM